MSPEARADFRLRVTPLSRVVIALAFLILVVIKLTPVWVSIGLPVLGSWRWGFDAETASFVTLAIATGIVFLRVRTVRMSPRGIDSFAELSERLLFAGKYSELLFLVERHFDALKRLVERRHVATRLRAWITPDTHLAVFIGRKRAGDGETMEEWEWKQRHPITKLRRQVVKVLPDHEERQKRGKRLLERVFLAEPFVEYLSKARPDFALRVLDVEIGFFPGEFLDLLITAWMRNPRSVLYEETLQNQNTRGGHRYRFEPLNPILWYFFGDRYRADPLHIYKPVGDFVSGELRRLHRAPSEDWHRALADQFAEEGKWRSPIHLGIRIFDFWIGEELHRGSHWHGWLMYLGSWTQEIVANMADLDAGVDHTREFPTGYHYLLYEIFSSLDGWLDDAKDLDETVDSVKIDKMSMTPDTILKSAIITTGTCLRHVLESENVRPEFKGYLLGIVLRHCEAVARRDDAKILYERAILEGGQRFGDLDDYIRGLYQALPHVDRLSLYGEPGNVLYESLVQHIGWTLPR